MSKTIVGTFLLYTIFANAQGENLNTQNDTINKQYKTWSVEFSAGQNKALEPFTPNYYQSGNTNYFNFSTVNSFNIGVRKMFNPKFGLKLNFAFNSFSNAPGTSSLPFETKALRASIEGVLNLSRVLEFENFSNRLGLLAHAGIQVSDFSPGKNINFFQRNSGAEDNGGLLFGITPQFKITNWLVFNADVTYVFNVRQHYTWDGQSNSLDAVNNSNNRFNLSGSMIETTAGLTFYFGKKEKHADWYLLTDKLKYLASKDDLARQKIAQIEEMLLDTDRDGVPDYRDAENNTPPGIIVDPRGRFIDLNKNGVPDDMERKVNELPTVSENTNVQSAMQRLFEEGYMNLFFDVNKFNPAKTSIGNVYLIVEYLRKNPNVKATLKGFADRRGNDAKNLELSKKRAQNIYDIIVASGIDASRLTIIGEGIDNSYPDTQDGLNLARRVSIFISK